MSNKDIHKQAKASWLGKKVEPRMIPHYLNLLQIREDALLLHGMPESKLQQVWKALKKDLVAIQGIPLDVVETSFADAERWTNGTLHTLPTTSKSGVLMVVQSTGLRSYRRQLRPRCTRSSRFRTRPNGALLPPCSRNTPVMQNSKKSSASNARHAMKALAGQTTYLGT